MKERATSWQQALVHSEVEINRAMFELNRPGALRTDPWYAEFPDVERIRELATQAIADLRECLSKMPGTQLELIALEQGEDDATLAAGGPG